MPCIYLALVLVAASVAVHYLLWGVSGQLAQLAVAVHRTFLGHVLWSVGTGGSSIGLLCIEVNALKLVGAGISSSCSAWTCMEVMLCDQSLLVAVALSVIDLYGGDVV